MNDLSYGTVQITETARWIGFCQVGRRGSETGTSLDNSWQVEGAWVANDVLFRQNEQPHQSESYKNYGHFDRLIMACRNQSFHNE